MRSELNGDNFGYITFKGSLVGGPPRFGDIEMCPNGFGKISNSHFVYMLSFIDFFSISYFNAHYVICNVN